MTQVRFGAGAVKSRSNRSPARFPSLDEIVVRIPLLRRIPCRPRALIARSTLPGDAWGCLGHPSSDQGSHLPAPIEPLWSEPTPALVIDRARDVAHGVDDQRVADGALRDRTRRVAPGAVGSRGNLAALLTQHPADRLDREALGSHLLNERRDHRLRG